MIVRIGSVLAGLCAALALSACAENAYHLNTHYLSQFATAAPTLENFTVCHGFGCAERSNASLSLAEWQKIKAEFQPRARNAKAERQQIAKAVALIQRTVGPQTGTAVHQWTHRNKLIYPNFGDTTQLDCVDEAVNTWTYMTLMERGNLLHFHSVARLANAGGLNDPFMRNTAVLKQKDGDYYAIDASIVDGGVPPPIIPLTTRIAHWPPDLSKAETVASSHEKQPAHKQKRHAQSAKRAKPAARPTSS
jgi:hypothetical protein